MIDDAPHHIEAYAANTEAHIFIFSQPWNRYIDVKGKISRVHSWDEISDRIMAIALTSGISKTPFRELLDALDRIPSLDRIRFTSSNPHDMTRDILDAHFEL